MRAFTLISLLSATASVSAAISPWSLTAYSDFHCQDLEVGTSGRSDSTDCQTWGDGPVSAISVNTGDFEVNLFSGKGCSGRETGIAKGTTEKCLSNADGWRSYQVKYLP